jgi:uncharacterized membrane protein YfhO
MLLLSLIFLAGCSIYLVKSQVIIKKDILFIISIIYFALFFIFSSKNKLDKKTFYRFLILLIVIELSYNCYMINSHNRLALDKEITTSYHFNEIDDAVKYLQENTKEKFYRTHGYIQSGFVYPAYSNYQGTAVYYQYNNKNIFDFLKIYSPQYIGFNIVNNTIKRDRLVYKITNLTGTNWYYMIWDDVNISNMLNVKYIIANNDSFLPYGYKKLKDFGSITVYENENYLPLGYIYTNFYTQEDIQKKETLERSYDLLDGFVAMDISPTIIKKMAEYGINKMEPSNEPQNIGYTNTYANILPEIYNSGVKYKSETNDPIIMMKLDSPVEANKRIKISFKGITETIDDMGQIFWREEGKYFNENDSIRFDIKNGSEIYEIDLFTKNTVYDIRIDFGATAGQNYAVEDCKIEKITSKLDYINHTDTYLDISQNSYNNGVKYKSTTGDPQIVMKLNSTISGKNRIIFSFKGTSDMDDKGQLYWRQENTSFKDENVYQFDIKKGSDIYEFVLNFNEDIDYIRLDFGSKANQNYVVENCFIKAESDELHAKFTEQVELLKENTMNLEYFSDRKIAGNINNKKSGLLFFSIPYDKGWTIKVDGKKVDFDKVNYAFMGVFMKEGLHNIELSYISPGFIPGITVSILCLLIYLLFVLNLKDKFIKIIKKPNFKK